MKSNNESGSTKKEDTINTKAMNSKELEELVERQKVSGGIEIGGIKTCTDGCSSNSCDNLSKLDNLDVMPELIDEQLLTKDKMDYKFVEVET